MDATDLNKTLKDLMDGLSVKVFRTYNASITLDRLLWEPSDSEVIDAKKADYDRANKEVLYSLTLLNSAHLDQVVACAQSRCMYRQCTWHVLSCGDCSKQLSAHSLLHLSCVHVSFHTLSWCAAHLQGTCSSQGRGQHLCASLCSQCKPIVCQALQVEPR